MQNKIFGATSLTGGGDGALDKLLVVGIDYTLVPSMMAKASLYDEGTYPNGAYEYVVVDSTAAENAPYIIKPDEETTGVPYTGNLRWELTSFSTARVKKHKEIKAEDFKLGSPGPTEAVIGNFSVLQFAGTGAAESVYTSFHIPVDWAIGTDVNIDIHWSPVDDSTGTVVWQMAWNAVASDANEVLSGVDTTASISGITQLLQDELLETGNMTILGTSLTSEDIIGITMFRDPEHPSDDYESSASLVWIDIEYISDKLREVT